MKKGLNFEQNFRKKTLFSLQALSLICNLLVQRVAFGNEC